VSLLVEHAPSAKEAATAVFMVNKRGRDSAAASSSTGSRRSSRRRVATEHSLEELATVNGLLQTYFPLNTLEFCPVGTDVVQSDAETKLMHDQAQVRSLVGTF
jgi:hypothetical protein